MLLEKRMVMYPEDGSAAGTGTGAPSSPAPTPAAATPSPAPAAGSEPAPAAAPAVDDAGGEAPSVDWAKEAAGTEDDGDGVQPAAPVAPAPQPAAAAPAAQPLPAAGEVKPAPAAAPAPQPAPAPAPAPAAPAPAPAAAVEPVAKTPEQIAAEKKAAEDVAAKEVKERFDGLMKQYMLPEDMVARLATEPEQVLPFLAAKVHEHVARNTEQLITQALPGLIHQVIERREVEAKAKNEFYSRWPDLNKPELHEKVLTVGALFRQLNPKASPQDAIEKIGRVVCEALGMPIPGAAPAPSAPGVAAPATPVAPAAPPFKPAGGAGTGRAAPAPGDNLFENLAQELLLEDSAAT